MAMGMAMVYGYGYGYGYGDGYGDGYGYVVHGSVIALRTTAVPAVSST